jgi:hypothetical protein
MKEFKLPIPGSPLIDPHGYAPEIILETVGDQDGDVFINAIYRRVASPW